jgi:hypothetical protein
MVPKGNGTGAALGKRPLMHTKVMIGAFAMFRT